MVPDGPQLDIDIVPTERAVQLDGSLTFLCGTNLESNPLPSVSWTDPLGAEVVSSGRFRIFANASGVGLEVAEAVAEDTGTWTCEVTVEGVDVTRSGGAVTPRLTVGNFTNGVNVTVVGKYGSSYLQSITKRGAWTWGCK